MELFFMDRKLYYKVVFSFFCNLFLYGTEYQHLPQKMLFQNNDLEGNLFMHLKAPFENLTYIRESNNAYNEVYPDVTNSTFHSIFSFKETSQNYTPIYTLLDRVTIKARVAFAKYTEYCTLSPYNTKQAALNNARQFLTNSYDLQFFNKLIAENDFATTDFINDIFHNDSSLWTSFKTRKQIKYWNVQKIKDAFSCVSSSNQSFEDCVQDVFRKCTLDILRSISSEKITYEQNYTFFKTYFSLPNIDYSQNITKVESEKICALFYQRFSPYYIVKNLVSEVGEEKITNWVAQNFKKEIVQSMHDTTDKHLSIRGMILILYKLGYIHMNF